MSRVKKFVQQFYWLIAFFGFNWGQSCLATHVTPQNCTKCWEILLLLYNLHLLASDQKEDFVLSNNFWAPFVTKSNFWLFFKQLSSTFLRNNGETLWRISGNLWKARGWIAKYCRKLRCLIAIGQKIAEKPDLHFCVLLRWLNPVF